MHLNIYDNLDTLLAERAKGQSEPELPPFPMNVEDIQSFDELLTLIEFLKKHNLGAVCSKYARLISCEESIRRFNSMIGMSEPKGTLATQILSLCNRHPSMDDKEKDKDKDKETPEAKEAPFLHTVIYGPPGTGKTTMAEFLAELYLKFGIVKSGKLVRGDRANMIGDCIGETAIKTKALLMTALDGVFFIDEAYQLGHAADGNRCPFTYECITTIVQMITQYPDRLIIILAGYEKDIKDNLFSQNQGLSRRFPWSYTLHPASPSELLQIFTLQAARRGYTVQDPSLTPAFFAQKDHFNYSGGDTKNLLDKCIMVNDKRMFTKVRPDKCLIKTDIMKGYEIHKDQKLQDTATGRAIPEFMYT